MFERCHPLSLVSDTGRYRPVRCGPCEPESRNITERPSSAKGSPGRCRAAVPLSADARARGRQGRQQELCRRPQLVGSTGALCFRAASTLSARSEAATAAHPGTVQRPPHHRAARRAPIRSLAAAPTRIAGRGERASSPEAHRPVGIWHQRVDWAHRDARHAVVAQERVDCVHDGKRVRLVDRAQTTRHLACSATEAVGQHAQRHVAAACPTSRQARRPRVRRTGSGAFLRTGRTCRAPPDRAMRCAAGLRRC